MRGFVYDGAPSLVGGAFTALFALVVGGLVGAILVPAFVLAVYWCIWRIAGRSRPRGG